LCQTRNGSLCWPGFGSTLRAGGGQDEEAGEPEVLEEVNLMEDEGEGGTYP